MNSIWTFLRSVKRPKQWPSRLNFPTTDNCHCRLPPLTPTISMVFTCKLCKVCKVQQALHWGTKAKKHQVSSRPCGKDHAAILPEDNEESSLFWYAFIWGDEKLLGTASFLVPMWMQAFSTASILYTKFEDKICRIPPPTSPFHIEGGQQKGFLPWSSIRGSRC